MCDIIPNIFSDDFKNKTTFIKIQQQTRRSLLLNLTQSIDKSISCKNKITNIPENFTLVILFTDKRYLCDYRQTENTARAEQAPALYLSSHQAPLATTVNLSYHPTALHKPTSYSHSISPHLHPFSDFGITF